MKLLIDQSALNLLHCKRKAQLTVINGLYSEDFAATLVTGSAFHKLRELERKGVPEEEREKITREKYPTADIIKVLRAAAIYNMTTRLPLPILIDNNPAIEWKFKIDYGRFIVANRPDPIEIYLLGTIDDIHVDPTTDQLVFMDYKVSDAVKDSHQDNVMKNYWLSFQLPFYVWAAYKSGMLPADAMERIEAGRYRSEFHFVFHNGDPPRIRKYKRPAFPYDFLFNEVPSIVNNRIKEFVELATMSTAAPRDGMCVYGACAKCLFEPACIRVGTEGEVEYLSRIPRRTYDPTTFR